MDLEQLLYDTSVSDASYQIQGGITSLVLGIHDVGKEPHQADRTLRAIEGRCVVRFLAEIFTACLLRC